MEKQKTQKKGKSEARKQIFQKKTKQLKNKKSNRKKISNYKSN